MLSGMKKKATPKTLLNLKSLPRQRRNEIRRRLFDAWKSGTRAYRAAQSLRIHRETACSLYRRFRAEGEAAVAEKRRGPARSPRAILTEGERTRLARAITGGSPRQMVLDFALWSSRAVVAFVRKTFGKRMGRRTARRTLQRLGFTYQCPARRAREQNPKAVRDWLEKEYPAIRRLAQDNHGEIFWEDEATCQATETRPRGYSPRGSPPVLRVPSRRDIRCNYAAAVSNRGELYFEPFEGALNAERFKGFVTGLLDDVRRPVVMITDNLKVHHANCLKEWFEELEAEGKLWVRYLPSYSPELNPEEYVNRDVKAAAAEMDIPGTAEAITAQTVGHLESRRRDPEAVRRVAFHHPSVAYAVAQK